MIEMFYSWVCEGMNCHNLIAVFSLNDTLRLSGGSQSVKDKFSQWREMVNQFSVLEDRAAHAQAFADASIQLFHAAAWVKISSVAHRHPEGDDLIRLAESPVGH